MALWKLDGYRTVRPILASVFAIAFATGCSGSAALPADQIELPPFAKESPCSPYLWQGAGAFDIGIPSCKNIITGNELDGRTLEKLPMQADANRALAYAIRGWLQAGYKGIESGDNIPKSTRDDFSEAYELTPNAPWVIVLDARVQMMAGNFDKALALADRADKISGNAIAEVAVQRGLTYAQMQDWEKAISAFEDADKRDNEDYRTLRHLAYAQAYNGNYTRAADLLTQIYRDMSPSDAGGVGDNLAALNCHLGKEEIAFEQWKSNARFGLGEALTKLILDAGYFDGTTDWQSQLSVWANAGCRGLQAPFVFFWWDESVTWFARTSQTYFWSYPKVE